MSLPMSELVRVVTDGYGQIDDEMKLEYGPSALLNYITTRLAPDARADIAKAGRLKRAALEETIANLQAKRAAWIRQGSRRRRRA